MKNKTIYIGPSGSGKSYKAIKQALNNEGYTLLINGCVNRLSYKKAFPDIEKFKDLVKVRRIKNTANEKHYLYNNKYSNISCYLDKAEEMLEIFKDQETALFVFDDNSWCDFREKTATLLEQLTHIKCGVVIVVQDTSELIYGLEKIEVDEKLNELSKTWNIVYCSRSDWTNK